MMIASRQRLPPSPAGLMVEADFDVLRLSLGTAAPDSLLCLDLLFDFFSFFFCRDEVQNNHVIIVLQAKHAMCKNGESD